MVMEKAGRVRVRARARVRVRVRFRAMVKVRRDVSGSILLAQSGNMLAFV